MSEKELVACHGVIPKTFIACGEGENYCSEECLLRALLQEARVYVDSRVNDMPGNHARVLSKRIHEALVKR